MKKDMMDEEFGIKKGELYRITFEMVEPRSDIKSGSMKTIYGEVLFYDTIQFSIKGSERLEEVPSHYIILRKNVIEMRPYEERKPCKITFEVVDKARITEKEGCPTAGVDDKNKDWSWLNDL